jgi:hypothetical protein
MDSDLLGFLLGIFAGLIMGVFIWGNLGAYLGTSAAEDAYGKQYCEARCAPTTPHYAAKLLNGKLTCTCLVEAKP